jgi:hypothetical protein
MLTIIKKTNNKEDEIEEKLEEKFCYPCAEHVKFSFIHFVVINEKTPWSESASDRTTSGVPRGQRDGSLRPYSLGFLDRNRYFSIK